MTCATVFGSFTACAQGTVGSGTFQDLNFEAATLVPVTPGTLGPLQAGPALPGWTAYIGSSPQSEIYNGGGPIMGDAIVLIGPQSPPIDGNYSLLLSVDGFAGGPAISLEQTGMIPSGANSIEFVTLNPGLFSVSINGSPIALTPLSQSGYIVSYGGNISRFAGTTATLQFTALANSYGLELDDISFSSQSVPEPGTLALASLGGLALVPAARKKRR
jgi:hypothetical protein